MFPGARHEKTDLAARLAFFFVLWLMIAGWNVKDLPVGLVAAFGALWISVALRPAGGFNPRFAPLALLLIRFLRGSVIAGVDVARRALSPQPDLHPGFVACPLTLPPGIARNAFCLHQSLQPGTLPTGGVGDRLFVHGLDIRQPIAARLTADEALFKEAISHE